MVIGNRDYTHFTPKHITNDILKYQVSKMNTKKIGDSRVNRCFPSPEVKNLETKILYHIYTLRRVKMLIGKYLAYLFKCYDYFFCFLKFALKNSIICISFLNSMFWIVKKWCLFCLQIVKFNLDSIHVNRTLSFLPTDSPI